MSPTLETLFVRFRTSVALPLLLGIALFVIGSVLIPGFASERSARAILVLASFVGLASIGQTLVIVMGGIDLSIPFLVGVANVVGAKLFEAGLPDPLVIVATVGLTAAIGALNGFPSGSAPPWVTGFVSIGATTGPIPVPPIVLFWLLVTIAVAVVERATVYGRRLFALGSNPRAAELALIRPLQMWVVTFAASGAFAGITGLLFLGFTGKAQGNVGDPLLFQSIAAVVIGGTSLIGGLGGYGRTALGAIVLILLNTLLLARGVESSLIQAALGVLIILLVSIYGREPRLRDTI
jgi:ribose transport system permease protein